MAESEAPAACLSNAAAATDGGQFQEEVVPTWGRDESGHKVKLTADQCIRRDTSPETLAALPDQIIKLVHQGFIGIYTKLLNNF